IGDDLLRDHSAAHRRLRQLHDSVDDRREGYGVPEAEHAVVLVYVAGVDYDPDQLHRGWGGWSLGLDGLSYNREFYHAFGHGLPLAGTARCGHRADSLAGVAAIRRRVVDGRVGELHHHDHESPRGRHDDVPHAAHRLVDVHHRHPASVRLAGADGRSLAATAGQDHWHDVL